MARNTLICASMKAGALVTILDEFAPPPLPINLVYAAQRLIPQKLRAFLDYATPRLRAVLV